MSNTRSFKFGGVRSTVAVLDDGSCLELRRGSITWTRKFKEEHPEIRQQRWASLTSWYATLPVEMDPVEEWHMNGGWTGPTAEAGAAAGDLFGLSTHLAYFVRRNTATAGQIMEAIQSYVSYQKNVKRRYINGDPVICGFFGFIAYDLEKPIHVFATLSAGGHMFFGTTPGGPEWPSVTRFNLSGKRPILGGTEGDLEFSPEMMYFMGGWPSGTWADVQRVYEAYLGQGVGAAHPRVDEGYIVTDTFLRHMLQTKKRLLPWSSFRHLMLDRGLVWSAALPALTVEPVEVSRPVERRLSFGEPMEIDEGEGAPAAEPVVAAPADVPVEVAAPAAEAEFPAAPAAPTEAEFPTSLPAVAVPAAPSEAEINAFMARVAAQKVAPVEEPAPAPAAATDPFSELDDLWEQTWDEMEAVDDCAYHVALMEELLTICLREEYAVAWRTNTFKRIQMRAALRVWTEVHGEVEMVSRFLRTYPA
jgi:hypothetical protein